GSSTRRIKCLILYVLGLWCNEVDGAKDKQFRSSYKICGPKLSGNHTAKKMPTNDRSNLLLH
ncbi:MAG: hypothetical protein PF503_18150, partial [Desulfobacula sp.]|nr:hypothetical protein [Desulfobacula sp.]